MFIVLHKVYVQVISYFFDYLPAISLVLLGLIVQSLSAQTQSNTAIDFNVNNEKVSTALYKLANESDINFAYNSGDIIFDTKVSYLAKNKKPIAILSDILSEINYTFKIIGNQVVIYKPNNSNNSNSNTFNIVTDTVFIQDTIFNILTDTIYITDTIFIEKQKPKKITPVKLKEIPSDYFSNSSSREKGWSGSIFVAPILSNFSLAQNANSTSFRSFSFGIETSKIINRWNISGGIKLTQFSEKFNHTYNVSDGGYFVTDTIDTYYTVIQTDTAWYYITDSTFKPIDSHEYSYSINNRVGYIEFSVSASFDYFTNRTMRLYVKAGAQAGVLIYSSGMAIPDADEPAGVDFADLKFSPSSYSVLLGMGIKYRINKQLDFNSEIYYLNYFTDMIDHYPKNTKIRGAAIKVGLIYYF